MPESRLSDPRQPVGDFVRALQARGIRLGADGAQLRVSAPAGVVDRELQQLLRDRKPELLAYLADGSSGGSADEARSAPLSPSQESLWFFQELEPDSSTYNATTVIRIEGELESARLRQALMRVLERHEPLRSVVDSTGAAPVMRPQAVPTDFFRELDLSGVPGAERAEAGRAEVQRETARPFDLRREVPFRAVLLRYNESEHELVTTMHHIIVDGVSMPSLYRDLVAYYGGEEPPPLRARYLDYAADERFYWTSERLEQRLAFWRAELAGAPPVLDLPTDGARAAQATHRGAMVAATLDVEVWSAVQQLMRTERASLFMVLLAGMAAALHRVSGQRDLVIGTPLHGRHRPELSDVVGMFVNQLPLRVRVERGSSLRTLVRQTRATMLRTLTDREIPFARLVEGLDVKRDGARSPVFQVMLNVLPPFESDGRLRARGAVFRLPSVEDVMSLVEDQAKFDVTLYVLQRDGGCHLSLLYNTTLFSESRARTLLETTMRMLAGAAAADRPLAEFAPPPPRRLSGTEDRGTHETVVDRVLEHASRQPGRTALSDAEGTVTYGELADASRRVAAALGQELGDDRRPVGVMVPHDRTIATAILGVLRSGRPYVPLDPEYPELRLRFMAGDARLAAIVTTGAVSDRVAAIAAEGTRLLLLDDVRESAAVDLVAPAADDLAYLLYTSGSTGQPKAVMQSHRNLLLQAERYAAALDVTPEDRLGLLASISFDACLMDLFGGLVRGACVCPINPRTELPRLADIARAHQVTTLHFTPTVFRALGRNVPRGSWQGVRAVVLGGEPVRAADIVQFDEHYPDGAVLLNLYGASEHSFSIGHFLDRHQRSIEVPIGAPLGDVEVLLLDEHGSEDDVSGEIAIRSASTALGYWGAEAHGSRAFAPDPARPGGRVYRTGDLARRRPDGLYVALGRVDNQVKVRGHRIEPDEIESALRAHPAVADVGVHAPTADDGERTIVACYTAAEGASPVVAELAAWCEQRLPGYMVPSRWVTLDQLPRTPSGKVDRRSLPAGRAESVNSAQGQDWGAEESLLLELWRAVLGRDGLGLHDNFFLSGGHSLSAMQVIARIRDVLEVELPLRVFFDDPTIAATAAWIREHRNGSRALPPLRRIDALPGKVPLSFSQERMWLLHELAPDSAAYNMGAAVRLHGALDLARFRAAMDRVVERQEGLRTIFPVDRGRPAQSVAGEYRFITEYVEGLDLEARLEAAALRAVDIIEAPYDLAGGPLFRVAVLRIAEDDHVLVVAAHHVVADLWSFAVLGRELAQAYNEAEPAHEPLPVRYVDYSVWQRETLQQAALDQQIEDWRTRLEGLQPLELACDLPRPAFFSFEGGHLELPISPELRAGIERLSTTSRATPFMTTLAAFNALLHAYSRQQDIAVGVPIANRTRTATENLVGTFVNTLVHRNDVSGDPTFRELLGRVRATALDAFARQDTPFELLVKELGTRPDPSRPPVVQVLFNMANVQTGGGELHGLRRSILSLGRRSAQFELLMNVGFNALQSQISFTFNSALFTRTTAERMLAHYAQMLERVVANPDVRLSELAALVPAARGLLDTWNDTGRDYPAATSVPALFAVAAQRTPDAIAVESPTGSFTYAELLDHAQRVTAALQAAGVQPGDRVAILMERSREMLGALLGILGSGAAYIPVDPAYPEARIRYVLEDAGARLIVTHRGLERRLGLDTDVLDLDRWSPPVPAPFVDVRGEQAAYAIYTSGSTGKPKGVEVPHGAMANFLLSMQERPGITQADRLLAVTTISFDIAVLELYLPLITGARVVIASEDEALDGRRLLQRMQDAGITLMQATPATWKLLISSGWTASPLLRVLCGGEPLPRALADELLARVAELWNMYGPTETTVWSTVDRIESDGPILIGRPIANTTVYVLGDQLELRPIGVPGELWIGGAGVANGYVNRPDLTAERFIESPFRAGERLYRTGDLVRWRHDGRLEHMGRLDHQVKIRGFRIELGEVEAALVAHDAVQDAVVAAREDRLVGYVVLEPGRNASNAELRTFVAATLPPYMVPSLVVTLDAMPLTPNGKVDRKQLPDPADQPAEARAWEPPSDPAARAIAEVWASLIGIDQVSVTDNFFEIGGHSLLAMQAVALIEERTGHRIEPRSLFFMTLEQLAETIPAPSVPA